VEERKILHTSFCYLLSGIRVLKASHVEDGLHGQLEDIQNPSERNQEKVFSFSFFEFTL